MQTLHDQLYFKKLSKIYAEKTKRLIVFCGAGASLEADVPNWTGLIETLKAHYLTSAHTTLGEKIAEGFSEQIDAEPSNWNKMGMLKEALGEQYEQIVRTILQPKTGKIPTFHRKIWDLDPHAILSFNLDNLTNISFAERRTGTVPNYLLGKDAASSRTSLGDGRPLIVDLHGNIENPRSWVLTNTDIDELLGDFSYIEFLKSMFTHNLVLFYGVGVDDLSVTGQLSYLKSVNFITGDYFLVKRKEEAHDLDITRSIPLNIIYTGEDRSWEEGFKYFVEELKKARPQEPTAAPVLSAIEERHTIPSVDDMLKLTPDAIRLHLASATKHFSEDGRFDYKAYQSFCREYDTAIHISTRVNPNSSDQYWLGNRIASELGRGNFGKVYQAFDKNEESIAIKVAHMEVRDDEAMLNSFRRGVESMRLLSQSNLSGVVKIKDASELPPSLVMEYIQGVDLQKYINDNYTTSVSEKLQICLWISEIIFECHSHEMAVLHRDLRPSNIMICGDYWESVSKDKIRVLDFDLAWFKGASGVEFYMNASQALGFLAPEQLDSRSKYSTRSALVDVYGLAMLLYFVVSSEIPLASASTRTDWPLRVRNASSSVFNKDWRSTKYLFQKLIARATDEDQSKRPTLQDFIHELNRIIEIFEKKYPLDIDSCVLEILSRIAGSGEEFSFNRNSREGHYASKAGTKVSFSVNNGNIVCTMDYTIGESANRVTRGKTLTNALFRAKSKIQKVASVDERMTATNLGANRLRFSFSPPSSLREFNEIANAIDFAMAEISKD